MFDFAWSEIALIGVVALIAIGPKDMPGAVKAVADMVKKARRMAGEFQTHVDEMMKDADLGEVRQQINEIRNLDIKGTISRAVDNDGSMRRAFTEDPLKGSFATPSVEPYVSPLPGEPLVTPPPDVHLPNAHPDGMWTGSGGTDTAVLDAPLAQVATGDVPGDLKGDVTEAAASAPAFIPPSIASPPKPPAFIPPGTRPPIH
jgi:sec-independent protein translocase protein TatB